MPPRSTSPTLAALVSICLAACAIESTNTEAANAALRINCGGPAVDGWVADSAFLAKAGRSYRFDGAHDRSRIENPGPEAIYQTVRHQNHSYKIPLPSGRYRVRLHFTDGYKSKGRAMDYRINGRLVIDNLNVQAAAGGLNRVLVLEAVAEVARGKPLLIEASQGRGNDVFEAGIEILSASSKEPVTEKPLDWRSVRPTIAPSSKPSTKPQAGLSAIRAFTGAPTRIAWLEGSRSKGYTTHKSRVRLMGLDTEDGKGPRDLLGRELPLSKPLFTPDGRSLIVSDRKQGRILQVDWDTGKTRTLSKGWASDVWAEPATGRVWVYHRSGRGDIKEPILRFALDKPAKQEKVWSRTPTGHKGVPWFQLSADGTRFADAFPWSKCGIGTLKGQDWKHLTGGCWPGMSPDNSYRMFVFDGSHSHLNMFDGGRGSGRKVLLSGIPGKERKKVYHPQWSNHPRFVTVTSPERKNNNDLYLGKFDKRWGAMEGWVRVTNNARSESFSDVWIASGVGAGGAAVATRPAEPTVPLVPAPAIGHKWPGSSEGLVWLWESGRAKNEAPPRSGEEGPFIAQGKFRGRARLGRHYELLLDGGHFEAEPDGARRAVDACRASGEWTLEAQITPHATKTPTPVAILTFADKVILNQQGADLLLSLSAQNHRIGTLMPHEPTHILITHRAGQLIAYIGGKRVLKKDVTEESADGDASAGLILGDAHTERDWRGAVEGIAIYDRFRDGAGAALQAELAARRVQDRISIPVTEVTATLVQTTKVPPVGDIAPYRRALVENVYEDAAGRKLVVLQWAIMDAKVLPDLPAKPGTKSKLRLEPADSHPELRGEYRSADHDEFDAPGFLDIDSHRRGL